MLNKSLIQMFTNVNKPPPPMPWMVRPAISILMLVLHPQMALPTKKTAFANSSTGLRPKISLTLPHVGVAAAAASR
jgi:hypothetical protein